ncbi:MAG: hypothetical protein IKJ07_07950 [Clostridia bacterium]|nr:hypothetical protein [Clostridia bacterium]
MKSWIKILLGISLSVMCIFTSIGYASFTSQLEIGGTAEVGPPNAVYIVSISNVVTNGVNITQVPTNIGFPSTKFMSELVFEKNSSSISFDVLVHNATQITHIFDVIQKYDTMEGVEGSFSYANVTAKTNVAQGYELKSGEMKTFTVTLTYTGSNTNQTRKMLHELVFKLNSDELTQIVSKGVTDKFKDILNNNLEENISYEYDGQTITVDNAATYDKMVSQMETSSSSGKYIGNLLGANPDDTALLNALFEGTLNFPINGEEVPITVMVKEKDVYGTSDKEMVLFITGDTLQGNNAPVYAVVFSKDADGTWQQIGDIFEGRARVNGYNGSWSGTGSFDTESWYSTKEYYGVRPSNSFFSSSTIERVMNGYEAQNP